MKRSELRAKQRKRKGNHQFWRRFLGSLLLVALIGLAGLFYMNYPRLELVGEAAVEIPLKQDFVDEGIRLKNHQEKLALADYLIKGQVDTNQIGDYYLEYTIPYFGLESTVSRKVSVTQPKTVAPVVMTLQGSDEMNLYVGREYQELGVEVSGGDDANIQETLIISGHVDSQTPGRYQLTYQVTDAIGGVHEVQRVVNIVNKRIYLTFDDGPNAEITPQFLQILKEENVQGTFFVVGGGPDELIKQAYDEGHTIGLHTNTHDYGVIYASEKNYFDDLNQISQRVQRITGEESKIMRFPGGSSNGISGNYAQGIMTALVKDVTAKGYQYFDWNVSSGDGSNQASAEIPYQNVTTNLKETVDNVVLMHDTKQTSADALRKIIEYGKANGFAFEKLELDSFPAHHGVTN
ncbi:immunoglobulin-like domain-containing protein [Enterococcus sp. LJL90]